MTIASFEELFMHLLRDVYQAEKQHVKALPKMARNAAHPELQQAMEQHLEETKGQIERLEEIFEMMDGRARGQQCEAVEGLLEEAQEIMGEIDDEMVRDAGVIAAAQALEHYEIARYGTLVAWARRMGERDVVRLLQQTLREEHNANHILNELAEETINAEAQEASAEEEEGWEEEEDEGREERGMERERRNTSGGGARRRQQTQASQSRGSSTRRTSSGSSRSRSSESDLERRAYKDKQGNIHHHTRAYMRQRGG